MMKRLQMGAVLLALTVSGTATLFAGEVPVTPVMVSLLTPAQVPSEGIDVKGLRLNLLYGRCQNMYGLDAGLVNHTVADQTGLAAGMVNYTEETFIGVQVGGVNIGGRVKALQVGVYNQADDMSGLQVGLINHTRLMRGMQIGLINVIENNDLAFLPFINFFF
jgi:hypothetical protein